MKKQDYAEKIQIAFDFLDTMTKKHQGRLVMLPGLEKHVALALVGKEACSLGEYICGLPLSPIAPGVERAKDGTYSIYVSKPIVLSFGGKQHA